MSRLSTHLLPGSRWRLVAVMAGVPSLLLFQPTCCQEVDGDKQITLKWRCNFPLSTHLLPGSRWRLLALKGLPCLACQHTFGEGSSILEQKGFFQSKKRQQVMHKTSTDKALSLLANRPGNLTSLRFAKKIRVGSTHAWGVE